MVATAVLETVDGSWTVVLARMEALFTFQYVAFAVDERVSGLWTSPLLWIDEEQACDTAVRRITDGEGIVSTVYNSASPSRKSVLPRKSSSEGEVLIVTDPGPVLSSTR
jgi:hypothetical protein